MTLISSSGSTDSIRISTLPSWLRYALKENNIDAIEVSEHTGFPEIMDGRIKTLHPKIHAGILSRRKIDKKIIKEHSIDEIDIVVVNLYPFYSTAKDPNSSEAEIIEKIDIGGPALVRSAAKNYNDVAVITSTNQYSALIDQLKRFKGATKLEFRKKLSQSAFNETAYYDSVISDYFNSVTSENFTEKKIIYGNLIERLRYGENPHQISAIYSKNKDFKLRKIHGKQLSYNNYNDIFAALTISKSLPKNIGTVIIKHANPCGVSILKDKVSSYKSAFECDPVSAFGGIVSCNFKINKSLAVELNKTFLEVIIANGFEKSALKLLKSKKNVRIIDSTNFNFDDVLQINSVSNSMLIQSQDDLVFKKKDFKVVSKKKPNKIQFENLLFAFNISRHVKSNAIVLVGDKTTVGIGSGQPSRLDSCQIAINKMRKFKKNEKEIVAASDAFFPFVDGIEKLIQSGVSAVIQPRGSIRDKEIIKFADKTNTILIFSKTRHFRH